MTTGICGISFNFLPRKKDGIPNTIIMGFALSHWLNDI